MRRSSPGSGKLQKSQESGIPGSQGREGKAQPSSFIKVTKEGYLSGRLWDMNNAMPVGSGKISFEKGQRASPFIK